MNYKMVHTADTRSTPANRATSVARCCIWIPSSSHLGLWWRTTHAITVNDNNNTNGSPYVLPHATHHSLTTNSIAVGECSIGCVIAAAEERNKRGCVWFVHSLHIGPEIRRFWAHGQDRTKIVVLKHFSIEFLACFFKGSSSMTAG